MRIRSIINSIEKWVFRAVIAFLALLAAWFVASSFYDEDLAPGLEEFFKADAPIPDEQNGFIALKGLDAPTEAQMLEYGRTHASRHKDRPWDFSILVNFPLAGVLTCWTSATPSNSNVPCLDSTQLEKLLTDNQPLLANFKALYRYQHFQDQAPVGAFFGSDLIWLQQLTLAQLSLIAQHGNAEQAIQGWLANAAFTQRLMRGESPLVEKAVFATLRSLNADTYPVIAAKLSPEQLAHYQPQLNALFDAPAFGPQGLDVAATLRAQHNSIIDPLKDLAATDAKERGLSFAAYFLYKPNATSNAYYALAQEILALTENPTPDAIKANDEKYKNMSKEETIFTYLTSLAYNPYGYMLLNGLAGDRLAILFARDQYSKRQLLKLYTDARIQQIPSEGMEAFVAGSAIKNPFTGQAFGWDAEKRSLWLNYRDDPYSPRNYVPYGTTATAPSAKLPAQQ